MTKNEANRGLVAIMEALDAAGDEGCRRGILEAGLVASGQFGAGDACWLTAVAERGGIAESRAGHAVGLTARGRKLLAQARAFAAAQRPEVAAHNFRSEAPHAGAER